MDNIKYYQENVDYYNFKNDSSTTAYIAIFKKWAKLSFKTEKGFAPYVIGDTRLVFIEYMKNWFNCKSIIHLGLTGLVDSETSDFAMNNLIVGEVKAGYIGKYF